MSLLIKDLHAAFTCSGFVDRGGRNVKFQDCGFTLGPLNIECSPVTGNIISVSSDHFDSNSTTICGKNYIATPGFIDSHTHSIYSGTRGVEHFMRWNGTSYGEITNAGGGIHSTVAATQVAEDKVLKRSLTHRIKSMAAMGTTTLEIKSGYGGSPEKEIALLEVIRSVADIDSLPTIISTFLALHALPQGLREKAYCDSMIDTLPYVKRHRLAQFVDTFPEKGFFSLSECLRFSRAAKDIGFSLKAHADEITDSGTSAEFIRIGATSIDHLQMMNKEATGLLGQCNTVATLLPATSFFLNMPYANARNLIDLGAVVALATDYNPGSAPMMDFQTTNLLAAARLKMTPAEILCGSTYAAACAVGLQNSHGALQVGRVADILLWNLGDIPTDETGQGILEEIFLRRDRPALVIAKGKVIDVQSEAH